LNAGKSSLGGGGLRVTSKEKELEDINQIACKKLMPDIGGREWEGAGQKRV